MNKSAPHKPKVNRNKSLKNVQNRATNKEYFRIVGTRKVFPGQLIRLYANSLGNNFPGQILKELDPSEYLKQKQKLQVHQNLKTRKYNRVATSNHGTVTVKRRGPGARGSSSFLRKTNESFNNWLKRVLNP